MKKLFLSLFIISICFATGLVFVSCGNDASTEPEQVNVSVPTIDNTSFMLTTKVNNDYSYSYEISWGKVSNLIDYDYVVKFDDEDEVRLSDTKYIIDDFSADTVHTLSVSVVSNTGVVGEKNTLKFKGTKLDAPINVRIYAGEHDRNSFGFKGLSDKDFPTYILQFEEMDLDANTSRPFGTEKYSYKYMYNITDRISPSIMSEFFNELNLSSIQNVRVKEIPNAYSSTFNFKDNEVLEIEMPSDLSETSINLYASNMPNPTNVQVDMDYFNENGSIRIKWENTSNNLPIVVKAKSETGYSGIVYDPGTTCGSADYDKRTKGVNQYKLIAEYVSESFNHIAENSYSFHLEKPATEFVELNVEVKQIPNPTNIRIEDGNIKWDLSKFSDYVSRYVVDIKSVDKSYYIDAKNEKSYSLETFFNNYLSYNYSSEYYYGDFSITVYAEGSSQSVINNGVAYITHYSYSDHGVSSDILRLSPVESPQNVQLNYETKTISWDENQNIDSYFVKFHVKNSNTYTTSVNNITTNSFTLYYQYDLSDYDKIYISSFCDYSFNKNGNIVTLLVPSVYVFEIEEQ